MKRIIVAVCTYNRAARLPGLIRELRRQSCPIPFEILVVDNNCKDNTQSVLKGLADESGAPLRFVKEKRQGIVHARNTAIDESAGSPYMAFIDDDESPMEGWLRAAVDALDRESADCAGGDIRVSIPEDICPGWLDKELLGFLGEVRHSEGSFWITDRSTPVWSGNIAYRTSVFRDGLRFDERYNRCGEGVGGGEDFVMFNTLLERGARIRYRADMAIEHLVEGWKLRRKYFLKLHYTAGKKAGEWEAGEYGRAFFGVPPFMIAQALRQWGRTLGMFLKGRPGVLRQAMNGTYALGMIEGRFRRRRGNQN
ncbi:MAG: glycosyltransferase family 2 protein [Deltaproteobacteria bacterium]|nr:glycosyltransferase family 2 protein [Deltaproteobacteria bacterium]